MGKQRKKKGQSPDQPDQASVSAGIDTEVPHVPPLPERIAQQVFANEGDESDDDSADDATDDAGTSASDSGGKQSPRPSGRPSAVDVAEEHRQSIANILRSLTGSTDHVSNGDELSAKLQRELMGEVINNYEIVNVVSSGGMGDVFGAVHTVMGRKAAIKVLRPEHCGDPALVQRFFNEARAANAIRHPNIVEVLDVGILPAGLPYITMELLEGETLAERLRRLGTMDIDQAVNFAVQASGALQAAHRQGIVHRDLKPDNLFIVPDPREAGRELIKILDFGIAKLHGDKLSKVKTNVGSILGTPPYMSPEQCRGIPDGVDHRSDVYALGVILFEMLCGAPPFVADGIGDVMVMHLSSPPPLPTWRRKEIPARIEQTILWALEKNPDQRIPSMADFAFALGVGPTPVPYLATPTGLTAPSFGPRDLGSIPLAGGRPASMAPPALDLEPTLAEEGPPETAPPLDLVVTQYTSVPPPSVVAASAAGASNSLPPPPEEVVGGRRWFASIAWASAAGLLIAVSGWYFTNRESAAADEQNPGQFESSPHHRANNDGRGEGANRAHQAQPAVESQGHSADPRPSEAQEEPPNPAASNAQASTESAPQLAASADQPASSAQALASSSAAVRFTNTRRGPARPPVEPDPWVPTKSVAEVREALEAQAGGQGLQENASPVSASPESPAPEPQPPENAPGPQPTPATDEGTQKPASAAIAQPPAKAAATGVLNLAAAPWASVSLNGRLLGVTPLLNVRLPVGVHQLNLSNPELGKSTVVVVEISADKPVSRFVGWHKTP